MLTLGGTGEGYTGALCILSHTCLQFYNYIEIKSSILKKSSLSSSSDSVQSSMRTPAIFRFFFFIYIFNVPVNITPTPPQPSKRKCTPIQNADVCAWPRASQATDDSPIAKQWKGRNLGQAQALPLTSSASLSKSWNPTMVSAKGPISDACFTRRL